MQLRAVLLAAVLVLAPLSARAADLVVWWEKGFYAQEDVALREIVTAFEQETGNQVEVSFHVESELPAKIAAALEAEQPPDLAFGFTLDVYIPEWAFDDRLVDLTETVGFFSDTRGRGPACARAAEALAAGGSRIRAGWRRGGHDPDHRSARDHAGVTGPDGRRVRHDHPIR